MHTKYTHTTYNYTATHYTQNTQLATYQGDTV